VNVREFVVRVGTIGCFGGGAAVGALVPVPQKFEAAFGADWVVRAVQAFAWADPLAAGHTIGVVDIGQLESDLQLEVRKLNGAVAEPAEAVERIQRRMDAVERRRWWHW
jgi:hypothetical protein